MIHRTAIVDPNAQIDGDVEIGPYVLIEGPARIAAGTQIQGHAVISGAVSIGRNNRIGFGSVIGAFPQDLSYDPAAHSGVEIGDNNVLREYCTIHRGTKAGTNTRVGSNNLLMVGSHLGHNTWLGDNVILANNVLLGGYVEIHNRVFVGGGSVVHQFTRMGSISLMQGLSAISKDVPPFAIAAGRNTVSSINVIGLRRAGFGLALRNEAKDAFNLFYRSGLNATQAVKEAALRSWASEISAFWNFVASSKRGICSMARWSEIKGAAFQGEE
jgi:UDP-N-acetylglucosamine acyltransferase